ncbi:hypothetical protein JCM10212_006607 [Sporobolomyces blumeae]
MTIDDIVALIAGTDPEDVQELVLPQLQTLDKIENKVGQSKGKAKDASDASASHDGEPHVLVRSLGDGSDPLNVLDPAVHTVGYLVILNARLSTQLPDLDELMPKVIGWMNAFEPRQARLVPDQVDYLVKQLRVLSGASNDPLLPVEPLRILLNRWAPAGTLTAYHAIFLRAVINARAYRAADRLVEVDITEIDKATYPIKYQDHLLYHYLAGTVLALRGDYVRASDLLEICVSAPGQAVSLIQVDAYKKLVLVQLLAYGKMLPLPKYTSSAAQNTYKTLCASYIEYATAFAALDKVRTGAARDKARDGFVKDNNMGLVSLCDASLRRRVIQRLTETWSTLSLGKLMSLLGIDGGDAARVHEVENEVRAMVATHQLHATLTPRPPSRLDTVIAFSDDPEPYLSHETVQRVTNAIEKAKQAERALATEGDKIEESKDFVQKVLASFASGGANLGPAGWGSGMPPSAGGVSDEYDYGSTGGFGVDLGSASSFARSGRGGGGGAGSSWVDEAGSESDDMD